MIPINEFKARRERLLSQLKPNAIVIVCSASEVTRSRDTEYHFRQNSDFYYLTGFNEPDALLVLSNRQTGEASVRSAIFVREKDDLAEIWHGRRMGVEAAPKALKIDMAYNIDELDELLPELINGADSLYYTLDENVEADANVQAALAVCKNAPKQSKTAPANIVDVSYLIHKMRMRKSSAEIAAMQASANIACDAHKRAMQKCQPDMFEYQLEAHILHTFAMSGARFAAYNTIVGGGQNACILHYTENQSKLNKGDLVLIDAGAEYHGYASDVTRTFPVNGRFSEPQKALYNIVLAAQLSSIETLKPGSTLSHATKVAINVITQGLLKLGILQGSLQSCIEQESYKAFFMHGLGHYLGLDVHDVGPYKESGQDIPLEEGMVLTVEPGIYIADNKHIPAQYKNMGIRIEDNVVITSNACEVLTQSAPKTVQNIEAFMASTKSDGQ